MLRGFVMNVHPIDEKHAKDALNQCMLMKHSLRTLKKHFMNTYLTDNTVILALTLDAESFFEQNSLANEQPLLVEWVKQQVRTHNANGMLFAFLKKIKKKQ